MKTNVFVLIALLAFHGFESAPLFSGKFSNPKTCCGRLICLCAHSKGDPCPFRHGALTEHSHTVQLPQENNRVSFKMAPCHSEQAKTTSPSYSKDFCLSEKESFFDFTAPEALFVLKNLILPALFDRRLDQPPRALLLF